MRLIAAWSIVALVSLFGIFGRPIAYIPVGNIYLTELFAMICFFLYAKYIFQNYLGVFILVISLLVIWLVKLCQVNSIDFIYLRNSAVLIYPVFIFSGLYACDQKLISRKYLIGLAFLIIISNFFKEEIRFYFANCCTLNDQPLFGQYSTSYTFVSIATLYLIYCSRNCIYWLQFIVAFLASTTLLSTNSRIVTISIIASIFIMIFWWLKTKCKTYKYSIYAFLLSLAALPLSTKLHEPFASHTSKGVMTYQYIANSMISIVNPELTRVDNQGLFIGSYYDRIIMSINAIKLLSNNIFFGVPFDTYLTNLDFHNIHNSFLSIISRLGLFGILIILYLEWKFKKFNINLWYKNYCQFGYENLQCNLTLLGFIMISMYACTSVLFETPYIAAPLFFIIGYCLPIIKECK